MRCYDQSHPGIDPPTTVIATRIRLRCAWAQIRKRSDGSGATTCRHERRFDRVAGHQVRQQSVAHCSVGERQEVESSYIVRSDNVSFSLGNYDPRQTLTIDPVLFHSSYLGGSRDENREPYMGAVAVDSAGNSYVGGFTESIDFPVTGGPAYKSGDGFLTKFDQFGSVVYSLFIGGHGSDDIRSVAVDRIGNVYVVGATQSADFPTTPGTIPTTCVKIPHTVECIARGFVVKLSGRGTTLGFSTLLGGADPVTLYPTAVEAVAIDRHGTPIIVGGTGEGLKATPGAFQNKGPWKV